MPPAPTRPEHRGLAHVDVPAEERDRPERGLDLRPVAVGHARQPRRAGGGRAPRSGRGCASSSASPKSLPTKPIERNAMASVPASAPGPKIADEEQRPHQRVDRARRHQDQLREQIERRERHEVVRGEDADRQRQHQREQRAQRGDVDRLHQRVVHALGIVRPSRSATCARTGRRTCSGASYEELGDDLDRAQRRHDRGDDREVDQRSAPAAGAGVKRRQMRRRPTCGAARRHQSSSRCRSRASRRRAGRGRRASRCR